MRDEQSTCFLQIRTLTSQTFVVPVIPMMVSGSNDLGGELSQSDILHTHALVGIPGFTGTPWITRMSKIFLLSVLKIFDKAKDRIAKKLLFFSHHVYLKHQKSNSMKE